MICRCFPAVVTLVAVALFGCADDQPAVTPPSTAGGAHDHHDHDHAHEELGPHDGHLLPLGDSGYQAEWTHDNEAGTISVYVLDSEKQPAAVASAMMFQTLVGDEAKEYPLEAQQANGEGLASEFTITNGELMTALKMAEQSAEMAQATLVANLQNGEFRKAIEVHDHDHGHAH